MIKEDKIVNKRNEIKEVFVTILIYGIVGSFPLFLLLTIIPLSSIQIVEIIKSNIFIQLIVSILGIGSAIYLYFDLSKFKAGLR